MMRRFTISIVHDDHGREIGRREVEIEEALLDGLDDRGVEAAVFRQFHIDFPQIDDDYPNGDYRLVQPCSFPRLARA